MADNDSIPSRATELLVVSVIMLFLSTFFTIWRLIVRSKASFWMGPSDWLMLVGAVRIQLRLGCSNCIDKSKQMLCNVGMAITAVCSFHGAGRLLRDPFWDTDSVDKMIYQNHLAFASQSFNMYGFWVVKLSVCAYLLILGFSKAYKRVIWVSIF